MRSILIILITVLGLVLGTQVITLFAQYRINRGYKGIGYWLLGSSLMSLGFFLMPLVAVESLMKYSIIANPLFILGYLYIYIGIKKFLNIRVKKWLTISIFIIFNIFYYYNMFINNRMSFRTIIISTTIAIISFMIVYQFRFKTDENLSSVSNFAPIIFFVFGSINLFRALFTLISRPTNSYVEHGYNIIIVVIAAIISSNLWTFSLIIMVNQRLNIDNKLEKEKLELIFNTNIDAQLMTRLKDGLIIDVNDEFSILSGYSKAEVVGKHIEEILLWHNLEDRQEFVEKLNFNAYCKNIENPFERKDGSVFPGIISAKIIEIEAVTYVISVIRDITERKLTETKMKGLVKQLEIEKNIAEINAITDSLTGLYNRGYFDNTFRREFFRIMRSESTLSLIMLDIDHFKKFNDSYGHLAGDKCLQMISSMLKSTMERASDIPARYGGEEFIIILPETDEFGTKYLAEKVREEVENLAIPHESSETSAYVTVSVGAITVYPSEFKSPDQILKMVDDALYQAKDEGRNRCIYKTGI